MKVNRRFFFVGLGASAFTSAAQPMWSSTLPAPSLTRINLIFHGLFTFVLTDNGISVLTPNNDEHKYCYLGRGGYVPMWGQYSLKGVNSTNPTKPNPDLTFNAVVTAKNCGFDVSDVDKDKKSVCTLGLPLPNKKSDMAPLRFAPADLFYVYGKYAPVTAKAFPMIQVLSYDVDPMNASNVTLERTSPSNYYKSWKPYLGSGSKVENLHIFAEPDSDVLDCHAELAFSSMVSMIHANVADMLVRLKPSTTPPGLPPPTDPTNVDGLTADEESTLEERQRQIKEKNPTGGIRIVNCMNLIVN